MWIEYEWSNAKCRDCDPEIDEVWRPEGNRHVEQHYQCSHTQVDTRSGETREQRAERYTGSRKPTTCRNIPCPTKCKIGQYRMSVDLCREHFEDWR